MRKANDHLADYCPQAREADVVTQQVADEVLVYDMRVNQAHCLNGTASSVWDLCDGKTPVPELARQLENRLGGPLNEEMVWLALEHLEKAGLLTSPIPVRGVRGISRRKLMQKLAYAAVAIPIVSSVLAPVPAAAASGFCADAACTACTDLASTAICAFTGGGVSCGSCTGLCCRGGADCTTCFGATGPVVETCNSCKFGTRPIGDPVCPNDGSLPVGTTICTCDSTLAGAGVFVYAACSFSSV